MKDLNSLIKKVVLGSLASLLGQTEHASGHNLEPSVESNGGIDNIFTVQKPLLTPKLLLKLNSDNTWDLKSHRSHRSHSSHRSHYSSTSGSSGGTSSGSSGGSTSSGGAKTSEALGLVKTTRTVYSTLGSRVLRKGMTGLDVTELVNILLKKKYLALKDGSTTITGEATFDSTIEDVVKEFQKDKKLPVTGVVDVATVYTLKSK